MHTYIFLVKKDEDFIEEVFDNIYPYHINSNDLFKEITQQYHNLDKLNEFINIRIKENVLYYKCFVSYYEYKEFIFARNEFHPKDKIYYFIYDVKKHEWLRI